MIKRVLQRILAVVRGVPDRSDEDEPAEDATPGWTPPPKAKSRHKWSGGMFEWRGRTLSYRLFVPDGRIGPKPGRSMLVMLHGCNQDANDFATGTRMNRLARQRDMLVLYPEQSRKANPQGCWNWFKPNHQQRGSGEPALISSLVKSIAAKHLVDNARIYVAGMSAGGAMADILGRCYPDVFAAVGVHSGLPSGAATDAISAISVMRRGPVEPRHATPTVLPMIVLHGDDDRTVNIRNGLALVDEARRDTPPTITDDRKAVTRRVYEPSEMSAPIEFWTLHGKGHAWAGGASGGSFTDNAGAIDASAVMLDFFAGRARGDHLGVALRVTPSASPVTIPGTIDQEITD
jgi:poly(hydroxyalkanoate) depolymerase family esterase